VSISFDLHTKSGTWSCTNAGQDFGNLHAFRCPDVDCKLDCSQ
jgi:hypothetical protein